MPQYYSIVTDDGTELERHESLVDASHRAEWLAQHDPQEDAREAQQALWDRIRQLEAQIAGHDRPARRER